MASGQCLKLGHHTPTVVAAHPVPPLDKRQLVTWAIALPCRLIKHNVQYDLLLHLRLKCNSRNISWSSEFCMAPLLYQQVSTAMSLCINRACFFSPISAEIVPYSPTTWKLGREEETHHLLRVQTATQSTSQTSAQVADITAGRDWGKRGCHLGMSLLHARQSRS